MKSAAASHQVVHLQALPLKVPPAVLHPHHFKFHAAQAASKALASAAYQKAAVVQALPSVSNAVVNLQALHHPVSNQDLHHVVLSQPPSIYHAVQAVNKARVVAAYQKAVAA